MHPEFPQDEEFCIANNVTKPLTPRKEPPPPNPATMSAKEKLAAAQKASEAPKPDPKPSKETRLYQTPE